MLVLARPTIPPLDYLEKSKMRRTKVYIAGRMTNGGHENGYDIQSIRRAIQVSQTLLEEGFCPYCPQLSMLAEMIQPIPYECYLGMDFEWVGACDVVLRLEGESRGADREVEYALAHGIPVVYSLNELYNNWHPNFEPNIPEDIG